MIARGVRRSLVAVVVPILAVASLGVRPASGAVGVSAGMATATVSYSPGIGGGGTFNPFVCRSQSLFMAPITWVGAFVAGNSLAFTTVTTSIITGASRGCETVVNGGGTLDPFTFTSIGGPIGVVSNGTCSNGTYVRIGGIIAINLNCSATVTGPTGSASSFFDISVVGLQLPAQDGITTPITSAAVFGFWVGDGS